MTGCAAFLWLWMRLKKRRNDREFWKQANKDRDERVEELRKMLGKADKGKKEV